MTRAEMLKRTWRPAMGWALVFINLLYAFVTTALLLVQSIGFSDAIPFMLAQIGQLTVLGGAGIIGRSYEKVSGKDGAPPFPDEQPPSVWPGAQHSSDGRQP